LPSSNRCSTPNSRLAEVDIGVSGAPRAEDVALVQSLIREETMARAGQDEDRDLAVEARRQGELVGACYGGTWGATCELESLWVRRDLRGCGLGGRLLAKAESEAARRGCRQVVLLTHWIQAPGFYQRRGYEVAGRVGDYPAGSDALWYRKRLRTTHPEVPAPDESR
jgi:ribosomal protein S18 acetylase RimI-like enzyme